MAADSEIAAAAAENYPSAAALRLAAAKIYRLTPHKVIVLS